MGVQETPDYLKDLDVHKVAEFYKRLANYINALRGGNSLSANMLLHWLGATGNLYTFPGSYLCGVSFVEDYLLNSARPVFLSQKARFSDGKIGGIIPRIRRDKGFDQDPIGGPYKLLYEGESCCSPLSVQDALVNMGLEAALKSPAAREADIFCSMHDFAIVTNVVMEAKLRRNTMYEVTFLDWRSHTRDSYHFDEVKHLTVPNPDYQSTAPGAVASFSKMITIYHTNAQRLTEAHLAANFDDKSTDFKPLNSKIWGHAFVDIS